MGTLRMSMTALLPEVATAVARNGLLPPLGEGWDGGVCRHADATAHAPTLLRQAQDRPSLPQRGREPHAYSPEAN